MYILPLIELSARDLAQAGAKAVNLGILMQHGFPVPRGYCVTTEAYRVFVQANNLQPGITCCLERALPEDPAVLESVSAEIRALFAAGKIPENLEVSIVGTYNTYGFPYMAVRSSATAEDLPEMSFAGQQDTFLHIRRTGALLAAVKQCWASLWTERAIAYRLRNRVPQDDIALAVVVQAMVDSVAAGVLFTANPLTGKRSETVIDAALGLGEALVSGRVEPDHYLVDSTAGTITAKTLGAKALSIRGAEGGGTVTQQEQAGDRQALPDTGILELAGWGQKAAQVFGCPQDLEWAWAGDKIHVLQSRPITSLYPTPPAIPAGEFLAMLSFGAVQGMLDPITPLGRDIFQEMAVSINRVFGRRQTIRSQRSLIAAGERLFLNFTQLFRSAFGRKFLLFVIAFGEPGSLKTAENLCNDPRLAVDKRFMKFSTFRGLLRMIAPMFVKLIGTVLFPVSGRRKINAFIDRLIARYAAGYAAQPDLAGCLKLVARTTRHLSMWLFRNLIPAVASGQVPLQLLRRMCAHLPGGEQTVMDITRGLPHNVTTEMDLQLWRTACAIKADAASRSHFLAVPAAVLAEEYLQSRLPGAAQAAVARFMAQYGMRGLAEIDMGRERWRENPGPVFQALVSYIGIDDPARSPEAVFTASERTAGAAAKRLLEELGSTRAGRKKAPLARLLIKRIRNLTGLRESPKFAAIRIMSLHRQGLLVCAKPLVQAGILEQPADIFFLRLAELEAIAAQQPGDWKSLAAQRKAVYAREKLRRRVPRMLLSDGTCFYEGMQAVPGSGVQGIAGSPVSAGVAEGIVHVVLDPRNEQLAQGEILVCPGTDPSWTPLFLTAGGLVMEVGGMMTHGAVVAREYGIPAIVGVDQATTRLKTGQRIRMDGSSGVIELLI